MRLAIPHYQDRISPVFDTAGSLLLIDVENGRELRRESRNLSQRELAARAGEFLKLEANVLLCGAISAPLETLLLSSGVQVFGFLCGPVDQVIAAFLGGRIARPEFSMPGCHARRQRLGQTGWSGMTRGFGMGSGRGEGRGRGAGGGRGRMGSPFAAGPGGNCVCSKCGGTVPHALGHPCRQTTCPKCGAPMTRA